jgi:hypothetical protein
MHWRLRRTAEGIDERRPIEAVWYTGRMMVSAQQTLTGKILHNTNRHWFNAKFSISNTRLTDGFGHNQKEHESNSIGNIKTVKKFEFHSIKKADSFRN